MGGCGCASGEPVNDATGDFYDTFSDVTVPGAGIPMTFTRTYDAQAAQELAGQSGAPPGDLGYGWFDNLGMSITDTPISQPVTLQDSTGPQTFDPSDEATITRSNGSQISFYGFANGGPEPSWCPADPLYCPAAPRFKGTLSYSGTPTTFLGVSVSGTWQYADQTSSLMTYYFAGSPSGGSLALITDVNGDQLSVSRYSGSSAGQVPCPQTDTCHGWTSTPNGANTPSGELVEALNSNSGLLDEVFGSAPGQPQVSFGYTGSNCSTWGGNQPLDLCNATFSAGRARDIRTPVAMA